MSAVSLESLLRHELELLYSSELQTLEKLPRLMATIAGTPLKVTLELLRWETEMQLVRLERVGQLLEVGLEGHMCKATRTLYREGDRLTRTPGEVVDGGLLVVFLRLSQREIAGYGAARTYAHLLGLPEVAQLLGESLDEQGATFQRLRSLNEAQRLERAAA